MERVEYVIKRPTCKRCGQTLIVLDSHRRGAFMRRVHECPRCKARYESLEQFA